MQAFHLNMNTRSARQELEGRLHWALWGLEQGFLRPRDLVPPGPPSAPEKAQGGGAHVVPALLDFMGLAAGDVADDMAAGREGGGGAAAAGPGRRAAPILAGCERQAARLATLALAFLSTVSVRWGFTG